METELPFRLVPSTAGLAVLTTVVRTHIQGCTLTGHIHVRERSFVSTAWMDRGVSVLETMLDYTFPWQIGCLGVPHGNMDSLPTQSGTYAVEKCSGFTPGINNPVLSFTPMMTSCSILLLAKSGFLSMGWERHMPIRILALDWPFHHLLKNTTFVGVNSSKSTSSGYSCWHIQLSCSW